jgi:hypothetical protein
MVPALEPGPLSAAFVPCLFALALCGFVCVRGARNSATDALILQQYFENKFFCTSLRCAVANRWVHPHPCALVMTALLLDGMGHPLLCLPYSEFGVPLSV